MYIKSNLKLLPKQEIFLRSNRPISMYCGGMGSGKTISGALKALKLACNLPNGQGMICRETYPELEHSTKEEFRNILPDELVEYYNKKDNVIRLINGHKILFRSLDNEQKLKSLNLDWVWIDEANKISKLLFNFIKMRLRRKNQYNRHWFFLTMNPENKFNWKYEYFVNTKNKAVEYISATSYENTYLPEDYKSSFQELEKTDPLFYRRYVLGEWVTLEGLVYPNFKEDKHIIKSFDYDKIKYLYRSSDYGAVNPFVMLYIAEDTDGRFFLIDEIYKTGITVNDMIFLMQQKESQFYRSDGSKIHIENSYIDPSAVGAKLIFQENGYNFESAPNLKEAGINQMKQVITDDRFYVCGKCEKFIMEIQNYKYIEQKEGKEAKEEPEKLNDHAMDATRYFFNARLGKAKTYLSRVDIY